MKEYISKTEREHCNQVKEIFKDLSEQANVGSFTVVDAYPYGHVVLEWFYPGKGFDSQRYFTKASDLFDCLLDIWESNFLHNLKIKYGNTDLDDEEIIRLLSADELAELKQTREQFINEYRKLAQNW